ncbi:MAG: hypothetical protein AB7G13_07695 [Lautropia sp.]
MESSSAPTRRSRREFDVGHPLDVLAGLFTPIPGFDARSAAVFGGAVAAFVLLTQSLLFVPRGWGLEDFLGWTDTSSDGPIAAIRQIWDDRGVSWLAALNLAIDTLLFIPAYAAVLAAIGNGLARLVAGDLDEDLPASERRLVTVRTAILVPTFALVFVDLAENLNGLVSLGWSPWHSVVLLLGTIAVFAWMGLGRALRDQMTNTALGLTAGLALIAITWHLSVGSCGDESWFGWLPSSPLLRCGAHHAKGWLIAIVVLVPFLIGLAWLLGLTIGPLQGAPDPAQGQDDPRQRRRAERARFRSAIADMSIRSRYVLAGLVFLGFLLLMMDQTRDVVVAMAAGSFRNPPEARIWFVGGAVLAAAISMLAIWLMAFSCWLWTRGVCLIRAPAVAEPVPGTPSALHSNLWARDWARVLGAVPFALIVVLCDQAVQDAAATVCDEPNAWLDRFACLASPGSIVAFGVVNAIMGVLFIGRRVGNAEEAGQYYNVLDVRSWSIRAGLLRRAGLQATNAESRDPRIRKYLAFGRLSPLWLPVVVLGVALASRFIDLLPPLSEQLPRDFVPTLSLAVILCSIAFWVCLFGWLSTFETSHAVPLLGALVIGGGILSVTLSEDSQRVLGALEARAPGPWDSIVLWVGSAVLAVLIAVAYLGVMWVTRRRLDALRYKQRLLAGAALWLIGLSSVLALADRQLNPRVPSDSVAVRPSLRPTVDTAMAQWLRQICRANAKHGCQTGGPMEAVPVAAEPSADRSAGFEVYFVSSEGGGIRAAVWTSLVLSRLTALDPQFRLRTFSISAVSGGSVGAAVDRVCASDSTSDAMHRSCIQQFASRDHLSPLLGAWLFEEIFAWAAPTSVCRSPACGLLSRGGWFEQSLEASVPGLRRDLISSGAGGTQRNWNEGGAAGPHTPWLLLNATWVETGERTIASDLRIDNTGPFLGARDQLELAGYALPLATAAHNSARFPFVNAIGTLFADPRDCARRARMTAPDDAAGRSTGRIVDEANDQTAGPGRPVACGHLADGGYFDNSGGETTIDLIRVMSHCLSTDPATRRLAPACAEGLDGQGLTRHERDWLRERLIPRIVMIRNSVDPTRALAATADCPGPRPQPSGLAVRTLPLPACGELSARDYEPARPACAGRARWFVEGFGPMLTALQVGGAGARGRLNEARQQEAIVQLRRSLGTASRTARLPAVATVDLMPDGTLYPLGWHLSAGTLAQMERQADRCMPPRDVN